MTTRFIKPTTICIGDTIRTAGKLRDVHTSVVGVVDHIDQQGRSSFATTRQGIELVAWHGDGTMTRGEGSVTRITLIKRPITGPPNDEMLF